MIGENAVLLTVTTPGGSDRNADPGAPITAWSGRARSCLSRVRRTVISGGAEIEEQQDVLVIRDVAGAPPTQMPGARWEASTVVVEDRRARPTVTRTFRVTAMEHRAAGTIADSVRLELEEVR